MESKRIEQIREAVEASKQPLTTEEVAKLLGVSVEHARKLIRIAAERRYVVVKKVGRKNYVLPPKVKPCPSAAEIVSTVLANLPRGKPFKLSVSYVRRIFEEVTGFRYDCDKEIVKAVYLLHEMLREYRVAKLTRGALYEIQ